jgi:A/G-specific adenine glycosylase
MDTNFDAKSKANFTIELMSWYDANARILPWRRDPQPYKVWVSEIMLQQTQVKTALPYFDRFIEALPDIFALAKAEEEALLKLWEGLGYYNRVRNMQKAARIIVEDYKGALPASYELLKELPGIGDYTAGAIASIAFQLPFAAIDGNVLRVYSRLFGSFQDIGDPKVKIQFQQISLSLQPKERPGDFNQALMELGATVCLPNGAPLCQNCPFVRMCEAFINQEIDNIPVKKAPKARKIQEKTVVLVLSDNKLLLKKRENNGLLGGLLELPNFEGLLAEPEIRRKVFEFGLNIDSLDERETSKHLFTHIEWRMKAYLIKVSEIKTMDNYVWADAASLKSEHAIPSAFKAYFKYFPK